MAVFLVNATCAASTSSGNTNRCEASYLDYGTGLLQASIADDIYNGGSGRSTATFAPANAVNAIGAMILVKKYSVGITDTITVGLYEGASLRASGTIAASSIYGQGGWVYVTFGTPYMLNTSNTWTLKLTNTAASRGYWNKGATTYHYALVGDGSSAKPGSSDSIIIKDGITFTIDETTTYAAKDTMSIIVGNNSTFKWTTSPGASYTLTVAGRIGRGASGLIQFGDPAGTPISYSNQAVVVQSTASTGLFAGTDYYWCTDHRMMFEVNGAVPNYISTRIRTAVTASNTVVTEDTTGWTIGDTVYFAGQAVNGANTNTYTISNISGTTITLNTTVTVYKGAAMVNRTEYAKVGVVFRQSGTNANLHSNPTQCFEGFNVSGLLVDGFGWSVASYYNTGSRSAGVSIKNLIVKSSGTSMGFATRYLGTVLPTVPTFENVHCDWTAGSYGGILFFYNNLYVNKMTSRNLYSSWSGSSVVQSNNPTLNNIVATNGANGVDSYNVFQFNGSYGNVTDCFFGLCANNPVYFICNAYTFRNCKFENSFAYTLSLRSCVGNKFIDCEIGESLTPSTALINSDADSFWQNTFTNCKLPTTTPPGSNISIYNIGTAITGSFLRVTSYDQTAGDNRSWYKEGLFYYTSGTSGKLEVWNLENSLLTNQYNAASETVTGMAISVFCNVRINNAAYYSGTAPADYELPKLNVDYDGSSTQTATASANTVQQTLAVSFTPTTDNNAITVRLTQRSNQTGENGEVKYDTLKLNGRQYGKVFTTYTKVLDKTTDDVFYTFVTPSTNSLITVSNATTVSNYTGATITHASTLAAFAGTGGTPITTLAMMYDYSQYDMTLSANKAYDVWFYSIDGGLSYYCDYDLSISGSNITATNVTLRMKSGKMLTMSGYRWTGTIAGNVTLASAGTYPIILDGARNITFSGTGTYDLRGGTFPGTITLNNTSGGAVTVQLLPGVTVVNNGPNITLDNTVAVSVTGSNIVAGSVLYIQNTTDSTNIVNAINAGTTYSGSVNYSSNKAVSVVIRKKGYKTQEFTGTLTAAGYSFTASQEADGTTNPSYDATTAALWSYNTTTKKFSTTATTELLTVQDFHSYWNDYFANTARMMYPVPTSAATKYDVNLINGASFYLDTEYKKLKTGSITEITSDDFYGSVISLGNASASESIYIIQNGSKITPYWNAGNIDILVKTKAGGSWVSGGVLEVFTRDYSRIYCHGTVTANEGGKNYVSISTGADTNNTTSSGSLPTLTITQSTQTAKKIDAADSAGNYDFKVDAGGYGVQVVYEYLKWITEGTKTATLNGVQGLQYTKWTSGYPELQNGPLGTFLGGVFYGAKGLWLENVAAGDTLKYVLTDNSGATHQAALPPVTLDVTNIYPGSRLMLYDNNTSTVLVNTIVAGTSYSFNYTYPGSSHDIYGYLAYTNGATSAKLFYPFQGTATINGMSVRADQQDDPVWAMLGVDGSAVTEFSWSNGVVEAFINDSDNVTSLGRMYAWVQYLLTTSSGIVNFGNYLRTNDGVTFVRYSNFKIKNIKNAPLTLEGGYITTPDGSGVPADVFDLAGYSIFMGYPHVVAFPYSSGSGLNTSEHDHLMAIPLTGGGGGGGKRL